MTASSELPLTGVKVVDMSDEKGGMCGRYLADLGADVILVEPPEGAWLRQQSPFHRGESLSFAIHHANKRSVTLDLSTASGQRTLLDLLSSTDIWINTDRPGSPGSAGMSPAAVSDLLPHLVVVSMTDFGQTGPYSQWTATDPVHLALSGFLSRSGLPGHPPLLPPGSMAYEVAAIQAAWVALLAYWNRLDGGVGDHVDFSIFEAAAQGIDPFFGAIGTAAVAAADGKAPASVRGREDVPFYPIFAAVDGYVRIVAITPRQWQVLFTWLGEPESFADPIYQVTANRFRDAHLLNPLVGALFKSQTVAQLVEEGQRRGLPIAPVLSPSEVMSSEHYRARGAFVDGEFMPGETGRFPAGYVEVDQARAGFRHRAPRRGEHNAEILGILHSHQDPAPEVVRTDPGPRRPLAGVKVLDMGVIVMGGEAGRLFADQGADVLKIEATAFPDGSRGRAGSQMSASFAAGHRNMRGVGVNLRHPEGHALFCRLVAEADVLLSNFKPGTLEKLDLGYARLHDLNPALVAVTTSALGDSGPWSGWMGYGPLVRCVSGVTSLWEYPDEPGTFSEPGAYYPDHFVARVVDTAGLACLIGRRRSGQGANVRSSQAETVLMALSDLYLDAALHPDAPPSPAWPRGHDTPWGVFPCDGDDEWCVITVRGDDDWQRLAGVLDDPLVTGAAAFQSGAGRREHESEINALLSAWTRTRKPREVTDILQQAGVPAGWMQRGVELLDDPHLAARHFFRTMHQPGIAQDLTVENGPCLSRNLADPGMGPAPLAGEHTREACRSWLGLPDEEIDRLLQCGALEDASG